MSEQRDTYPRPRHGWTCFHCGETFRTPGEAADHFGARPDATPGCMLKVQLGEERGLLMALRKAEADIKELRAQNEQLDHEAGSYHGMVLELERYFGGARTVHQAYLCLDTVVGRALAAEEKATRLEALINTPETNDWMKGVELEAAHQQERWGADHDTGKTPLDWFWLIGYLAQKAASSAIAGDAEKARHHTISTGAALLNWHRQLAGDKAARMRPGIEPPAAA